MSRMGATGDTWTEGAASPPASPPNGQNGASPKSYRPRAHPYRRLATHQRLRDTMAKFNSAKDVRKHVRSQMGLAKQGRVDKTKQKEFEKRCKELCAEYGLGDWEVSAYASCLLFTAWVANYAYTLCLCVAVGLVRCSTEYQFAHPLLFHLSRQTGLHARHFLQRHTSTTYPGPYHTGHRCGAHQQEVQAQQGLICQGGERGRGGD